jgi:glycosyltransferase involved in cell wall biosynthesis
LTLVSVIMPVWHPREDWLRQAIESVLAEDSCPIELILVDDGNDRPVADLVADISDPRLKVMRVDHCGPYATRNAALRRARGNYIRFVDSDDTVAAGSTGRLLELARSSGAEILAYGATVICDSELKPLRLVSENFEGNAAEECLLGGFNVYVVSILYPRSVLDRSGLWAETGFRVSGDWDFVLRAVEHAPVRRLNEVVSYYRTNSQSVSRTARVSEGIAAAALVIRRFFNRHPELRFTELKRRAYTNLHLHGARQHFGAGQFGRAAGHLILAFRHDPSAALAAAGRVVARTLRLRPSTAAN